MTALPQSSALGNAGVCAVTSPGRAEVLPPITTGLDDASGDARIIVRGPGGITEEATLASLAASALTVAGELRKQGLPVGAPIAAALPTSLDAIVAIFAAWALRSPICLLPLRRPFTEAHTAQLSASLSLVRPGAVFIADALADAFDTIATRVPMEHRVAPGALSGATPGGRYPHPSPDDLAILQLTSGSTGQPKAVPVAHRHLSANVRGIAKRAQIDRHDVIVSWMPLYHDMGLSMVMQCIACGSSLFMMSPEVFSSNALAWLIAIQRSGGSVAPATPSALRLLDRLKTRAGRGGIGLHGLRYMWVGAEPVFSADLDRFQDGYEPFGLGQQVLQPAYGLAEAVVAVSVGTAGSERTRIDLDAVALRSGCVKPVQVAGQQAHLVGNGTPIEGIRVRICKPGSQGTAESTAGEIYIAGDSVPGHYLGESRPSGINEINTGDLGFLKNGALFITGRSKDLIVRGGQNIAPEEIERCVEDLWSLRPGAVIAFSWVDHLRSRERIVVLVDQRAQTTASVSARGLIQHVARMVGVLVDEVTFVSQQLLPRTTSGKLQRSVARSLYLRTRTFDEAIPHERA